MLASNYEYSRSAGKKLPLPIQLQLFKKLKTFWSIFIAFSELFKFQTFWKKNEPHSLSTSQIVDSEKRDYLKHKTSCFWKPFGRELVKAPKVPLGKYFYN